MNGWENLFLGELGAAAALTGLVFVGVSINSSAPPVSIGLLLRTCFPSSPLLLMRGSYSLRLIAKVCKPYAPQRSAWHPVGRLHPLVNGPKSGIGMCSLFVQITMYAIRPTFHVCPLDNRRISEYYNTKKTFSVLK
jgi:hypothetical protein